MIVVQHILPTLRLEIARQLVEKYEMKKNEAAKRMGVTAAAVSQYGNKSRGGSSTIIIEKSQAVMELVDELSEDIAAGKSPLDILLLKLCRACAAVRAEGLICDLHRAAMPGLGEVRGCSCSLGLVST